MMLTQDIIYGSVGAIHFRAPSKKDQNEGQLKTVVWQPIISAI